MAGDLQPRGDVLPRGVSSRSTSIEVEAETLEWMRRVAGTLGMGGSEIFR